MRPFWSISCSVLLATACAADHSAVQGPPAPKDAGAETGAEVFQPRDASDAQLGSFDRDAGLAISAGARPDCASPQPHLSFGGPTERQCFGRAALLAEHGFPRVPADEAGVRQLSGPCPAASALLWQDAIGESCAYEPVCDEPVEGGASSDESDAAQNGCCYLTERVCGV